MIAAIAEEDDKSALLGPAAAEDEGQPSLANTAFQGGEKEAGLLIPNGVLLQSGGQKTATENGSGSGAGNGNIRIPMGVEVRRERAAAAQSASIKLGVLIWLTVQNAVHALLLRYSRVRDVPDMYFSTVAVFWTEVIKFGVCLAVIWQSELHNGVFSSLALIRRQVFEQPRDTMKVCLPSMLYILQNNLFYTAASHLNAATFMIVSQLKIFSAAIFSIILLNRTLVPAQWFSLCILFTGVCFVQLQPEDANNSSGEEAASSRKHGAIEQNVVTGFTAACIACALSGFSGVFFEKILKGSAPVSLWMRNIQMSMFAIPASFFAAIVQDGPKIAEHGFMHGWDRVVWLTAFWYAVGGLSVAVCLKYADNIAKNFATSVAIILATLGSMQFFGFRPSLLFTLGAFLVILSIFLYSSSATLLRCFGTCFGRAIGRGGGIGRTSSAATMMLGGKIVGVVANGVGADFSRQKA